MNKERIKGFEDAVWFVMTQVGASQPAREIVGMMERYLKKLKRPQPSAETK